MWLREPGTPLDNNESERALKQFILMRKNSMFFKTEHGAAVGDVLASLIRTCRLNGVNAWDYLATIIRNKKEARSNRHLDLPWNYKREEAEALHELLVTEAPRESQRRERRPLVAVGQAARPVAANRYR